MRRVLFCMLILACCSESGEDKAPAEVALDPGWLKLFDGETLENWEVTNFGGQGEVRAGRGQLVLGWGNDLTGLTWQGSFPRVNYEVTLQAMRLQGNDFFCGLTFPVAESWCSLIVGGWGGTVVGLSSIDGEDASENDTSRLMAFEDRRWYRIRVRVTEPKIEAWIDGDKVVDLASGGRRFSVRPEVRLSRPFGIATWRTTAALRHIRLRRLEDHDEQR